MSRSPSTLRIWVIFLGVRRGLRRGRLPALVARLGSRGRSGAVSRTPRELSRAVDRALRVGRRRPVCLVNALVLYRPLRRQGDDAVLVIGLPEDAPDHSSHAWVELGGVDIGPPPGRAEHREMARFA